MRPPAPPPPPVKPRSRWRRRLLAISIVVVLAAAVTVIAAVTVSIRVETGEWRVPQKGDFVRIARRFDSRPSKVIYLERHAIELRPGDDYAASGISSVLANAGNKPIKLRGFTGGDKRWKSVTSCVQKMFAPFDVTVTDQRPKDDKFLMVVVGGKPADIGVTDGHHVAGLAPFNGNVIPRAVVFAFAAAVDNEPRTVCETIAMEVAHAYGLDHEYLCKDVMTYLHGCGAKTFVDANAPCGESKKRNCEGGKPTQNSFRRLVDVLGARKP
ncbi:MAG TPA: hypothetical protein VFS15_12155 [Kofleriaceae bacterium]|nr:hypothetical protein [Kofleriaceae bacterium]